MQLEQSFEVDAPLDRVWAALIDVERVAPCLPGAAVTGRNDDGSYNGTFTIKIGPTTASYTGKLEMQNIDESSHSATMHAQGSDRRGQGGATATINSRLTPADGRTRVEVMTDYHITGRLARFGRGGMIEDISERLLRDFASRLQASLTYSGGSPGGEEPPPAPVTEQPTAPHSIEEEEEVAEAQASEVSEVSEVSEQPTTESPVVGFDAPAPPPTEVAAPAAEAPPPPPPAPAPEAPPPPPAPEAPPPPPPESEPPPPLDGMSLVGSVLINRVKRNPAPVIAVVGGLVLLRLVMRKR